MAFEIQNYQSKYHQDINKMFESGVLECGYNTARGRFPFPFQKLPFFFSKKKKMITDNIDANLKLNFRWIQKCVLLGNVNHWIFSVKFLHFSNTCNFIDHNLRRCSYKLCLFFLPSICKVCCFFKYILKILRSVAMIWHIDSLQSAF